MKRDAMETIQVDKLKLLHAVVELVFGLDEPLQRLCLALLALHERQSGEGASEVLLRPINLHAEHFEDLLPPDASVTQLMRRLQLTNPHLTVPTPSSDKQILSEAPLFEIVSSLELSGTNPRINWWVRVGQWSSWGLTPFDRYVLCKMATTMIAEQDAEYHRLLAFTAFSVAGHVDAALRSGEAIGGKDTPAVEIGIDAIRDDLMDLDKMLNFLPEKTNLRQKTVVVVEDFVNSDLLRYTDATREIVRVSRSVNHVWH